MNCYYHNENAAVGQCSSCNKGLCGSCSKKFTSIICTECNNRNWRNNYRSNQWGIFYFFLYFILISFIIGPFLYEYLLYKLNWDPAIIIALDIYIMLGWAASFRYYHQPADNRITKHDVRQSENAWLADAIAWIIKFLYYGLIGPVILPLWIARTRRRFKDYKQYKRDLVRMKSHHPEPV